MDKRWKYSSCSLFCFVYVFFFFQAEDGIRDRNVTGVQTCALPIFRAGGKLSVHFLSAPTPISDSLGEDGCEAVYVSKRSKELLHVVFVVFQTHQPDRKSVV